MRGVIFKLSQDIEEVGMFDPYDVPEYFVGSIASHLEEAEVDDEVMDFMEYLEDEGVPPNFIDYQNKMTFKDKEGFQKVYFESKLKKLKESVEKLTLRDFSSSIIKAENITKLVTDQFDYYIYINSELMTLDDFIRSLDMRKESSFYITGSVAYYY